MSQQEDPRINLRLPLALKRKIAHASVDNSRSMNAEILARLEASFAPGSSRVIEQLLRAFCQLDDDRRKKAFELLAQAAEILSKP